ncbi:MAG: thiamine-phosphate kinase [Dehalococcoidales bacterium]|nr:thiamine-phosphate kinase [Dehalococcoidales bacterium]
MKVSELGELGLISLLREMVCEGSNKQAVSWQKLIIGIGDDTAAWRNDSSVTLATTDSLVQGVHFTLETTTWQELGWKALAISLSDIAAMGGIPLYALLSLGLPGDIEVTDVTNLYRGVLEVAQHFDVAIAGGNVASSPVVSLGSTVLGSGAGENVMARSAARIGDRVAVTGYLGAAAAGLKMLREQLTFSPHSSASFRQAFLRPFPRITDGQILVSLGVKTAIDISDGLLADLGHICRASRVGARINVEKLPVHPDVAASFGEESLELALSGGEDYELLFTASAEVIDQLKARVSCPVTVIGEITPDETCRIVMVNGQGGLFTLAKKGWQHFISG